MRLAAIASNRNTVKLSGAVQIKGDERLCHVGNSPKRGDSERADDQSAPSEKTQEDIEETQLIFLHHAAAFLKCGSNLHLRIVKQEKKGEPVIKHYDYGKH